MGKINLLGVAKEYLNTLRSYRTNKLMPSDFAVQIGLPVLAALAFAIIWPLDEEKLSSITGNVISGVSIVSALLCGVAVMVFQLRMQMSSQSRPPRRRSNGWLMKLFLIFCGPWWPGSPLSS